MQGLWLEHQQLTLRDDLPKPVPGPGEALVRVRLVGICGTDMQLLRGYYPFNGIPGHEFVGEVVEAPDHPHWRGRRVAGEINVVCGQCGQCLAGRPSHCERRTVVGIKGRDGAFAEFLTLPVANLHAVPDSVTDEAAVFTEPLAAALQIPAQVHVQPDQRVLVIGAGRLGQLIARAMATTACDLSVVARYESQRRRLERCGIQVIHEEEVPAGGADVVVEATGSPAGLAAARDAVRPRGTIVLKSTYKGEVSVDLSRLVVDEVRLLGSRCGPFAPALRLLAAGRVDPTDMIDERFPLSQGVAAFERAGERGVMKVVLAP